MSKPKLSNDNAISLTAAGYGICAHILQHNCEKLYILSKKEAHLDEAQEGLKKYGDTSRVETIQLDLEDLQQTDSVAKDLASRLQRLDCLILNAGLGVGPYEESKNGIDTHMQVNVISQYHLAMILMPLLLKTENSRLCLQSSEFHRIGTSGMYFKDLAEINQDIGPSKLYARTKLAQALQVRALVRRKAKGELGLKPKQGPWINATHPGGVVTDQQDQAVEAYGTLGKIGVMAVRPMMKDPVDEGCRPMLFVATSEEIVKDKIDGEYVVPDRKISDVSKQTKDEELQENVMRLTETVLAEKLGKLPYPTTYV